MSGKPKTIPSLSRARRSVVNDSREVPVPYDQNLGRKWAAERSALETGSDVPTDENFVDDDIIEENSHVIPPVRKQESRRGTKRQPAQ